MQVGDGGEVGCVDVREGAEGTVGRRLRLALQY